MEKKQKGDFFKLLMTAAFLLGTAAYFYAFAYSPWLIGKIGFAVMAVLSLLISIGITLVDMSQTAYLRGTSKLMFVLFPLSANGGAIAAEIFLLRQLNTHAVITVASACVLSALSAAVLVSRYSEDDL